MIAGYIEKRRWFRSKAKAIVAVDIDERFPLELAGARVDLSVARVSFEDGSDEAYVLVGTEDLTTHQDALMNEQMLSALLEKFQGGGARVEGERGVLVFRTLPGFDDARKASSSMTPKPTAKEQTNTSVPFGDAYILKIVRKLDDGRSAELEMGEFLTSHGYAATPPVLGAIEIERPVRAGMSSTDAATEPATVGILHRFQPNQGDAWAFTLEELKRSHDPAAYAGYAALLGKRVGEMHAVLGRGEGRAFAPAPLDRAQRDKLANGVRNGVRNVSRWLRDGDEARIDARLRAFVGLPKDPIATRVHGDLHLGQILVTSRDFAIIDFEGEPARPLAERKQKRSPLADVAGMLRSFDYAAATAKAGRGWYHVTASAFLSAYGDAPRDVLDFYLLEKCVYEIAYEANNRPDWIDIPLTGLKDLLA